MALGVSLRVACHHFYVRGNTPFSHQFVIALIPGTSSTPDSFYICKRKILGKSRVMDRCQFNLALSGLFYLTIIAPISFFNRFLLILALVRSGVTGLALKLKQLSDPVGVFSMGASSVRKGDKFDN